MCTFCGRPGHIANECRNNPNNQSRQNYQANPNNQNTQNTQNRQANNSNNGNFNADQKMSEINGRAMSGYVFKDSIPQSTGPELYCAACNSREHAADKCSNKGESNWSLLHSPITCYRCCLRGHLAAECQNPAQQRCSACHGAGHKTDDCKSTILRGIHASPQPVGLGIQQPAPSISFVPNPTQPRPVHPFHRQPQTQRTGSVSVSSNISKYYSDKEIAAGAQICRERELTANSRAIRAKVDYSVQSYRKQNYNQQIRQLQAQIQEQRTLSSNLLWDVSYRIAQGYQFWRDPLAMEAIATRKKPVCIKCGKDGHILDRFMNASVINDDVTKIEEFSDWGVFIMFDCTCCNEGFQYIPRFDGEEMQVD